MSAFICSIEQFKILAIFAASSDEHRFTRVSPRYFVAAKPGGGDWTHQELASAYADILYQENIRSVRCRYPDDKWDDLPGPIVKPLRCVVSAKDIKTLPKVTAAQLLKFCNCVDYQSCETPDWKDTKAYQLLEAIKDAAIHTLPGYAAAAWEYHSLVEA